MHRANKEADRSSIGMRNVRQCMYSSWCAVVIGSCHNTKLANVSLKSVCCAKLKRFVRYTKLVHKYIFSWLNSGSTKCAVQQIKIEIVHKNIIYKLLKYFKINFALIYKQNYLYLLD